MQAMESVKEYMKINKKQDFPSSTVIINVTEFIKSFNVRRLMCMLRVQKIVII